MVNPKTRREYLNTKTKLYAILLRFDESDLSPNELNLMQALIKDTDIQAILERSAFQDK